MATGKIIYDKDLGALVLTINLFQDDFSDHLKKVYHMQNLDFSGSGKQAKEVVEDYINKKFSLKINGENKPLPIYSLHVIEENVLQTKFYISIAKGTKIRQVDIYNELLFEAFKDQVNVIHEDIDGDGNSNIFRFYPGDAHVIISPGFICK